MTPVEGRIYHEEAKRITKDLDAISSDLFIEGRKDQSDVIQDAMNVISALLDDRDALLTEHSAREERIGKLENLCVDLEGIALRDADTIARLLKSAARRIAVTKEPPCQ